MTRSVKILFWLGVVWTLVVTLFFFYKVDAFVLQLNAQTFVLFVFALPGLILVLVSLLKTIKATEGGADAFFIFTIVWVVAELVLLVVSGLPSRLSYDRASGIGVLFMNIPAFVAAWEGWRSRQAGWKREMPLGLFKKLGLYCGLILVSFPLVFVWYGIVNIIMLFGLMFFLGGGGSE